MWFEKNGISINIKQKENENLEEFSIRGWFVVSQKPKNNDELKEAIKYSELYIYYKLYGNIFNKEVNKKILKMEKNIL